MSRCFGVMPPQTHGRALVIVLPHPFGREAPSSTARTASDGYLLLSTACAGTLPTTAQFTSVGVVCNNTLQTALAGDSVGAIKVPHRWQFHAQAVKRQLRVAEMSMTTSDEHRSKKPREPFWLRGLLTCVRVQP